MTDKPIEVLLMDGDVSHAQALRQALSEQKHPSFELHCVHQLAAGLEQLANGGADVILADLFLPDSQGLETYRQIHALAPAVPIVVVADSANEKLAQEAVRNGAPGYLLKRPMDGAMLSLLLRYAIERKRAEQFVSVVSHELRTPMTIIREGVSQVLDGIRGETTEGQRRALSIALEGIDRLGRLIDDLLDISKIEAGKTELRKDRVDLVSIAKGVISNFDSLAQERGLEIRENFQKPSLVVVADRDRTFQVFTNLIGNALKFTEKGHIGVSIAESGEVVECRVSDTGIGISKEDLPKVFQKFQQFNRPVHGDDKGTGLGLSICKAIVELHHGKIHVEGEPKEGTTFVFTFPKSNP